MKLQIRRNNTGWKVQLILPITLMFLTIHSSVSACNKHKHKYLVQNMGPVCETPGCVIAASNILKTIDEKIDPCENFYKFACGKFIKEAIIPDEKSFTISFNIISDHLVAQLRTVIEQPPKPDEPKAFKLLKQFYNVCLNTTIIDEDNLKTAKSVLEKVGGWPVLEGEKWEENKFDWKQTMYKFRETGFKYDILFNMYAGSDSKNSSKHLVNADQASLGLDREFLVQGFDNKVVKAYYEYLVDIAVSFGANKETASKELKESVMFEIELANITLPKEERRDSSALYNPTSLGELQKKFPGINWIEYVNNIVNTPNIKFGPSDIIDIGAPKYIDNLLKLLDKTPKRVQANYIMSQIAMNAVPYLTTELTNREVEYEKVSEGKQASQSRWMQCVEESAKRLQIAAGALYVREYFDGEAKKSAEDLVSNLRSTFRSMLKRIDWMDEGTRCRALEKAAAMESHVAYPSEFLDDAKIEEYYSKLKPSDNYLLFSLNVQKFDDDNSFAKLPEPVNKTDWTDHSFATTVNAYYNIAENSIQLPAGILQGAFFDNNRPNYMNYGAMGFGIGHEITHGFDDVGRQYDKNGDLKEWWAEKTKKAFLAKAQCIIDQYSNYTVPEVDMHLNGINTQGENIADNGGAKEAYLAYSAWVECYGEESRLPALDYTPKQMFWISLANLWCTKARNEFLTQQILTDYHAPAYYRVMGTISNSEFFANDFKCAPGSKMNPTHKCSVW